jgi:hypothetical protein
MGPGRLFGGLLSCKRVDRSLFVRPSSGLRARSASNALSARPSRSLVFSSPWLAYLAIRCPALACGPLFCASVTWLQGLYLVVQVRSSCHFAWYILMVT